MNQDREFQFKVDRAEKEDARNERADELQRMQIQLHMEMMRFFGSAKDKKDKTTEVEDKEE